MNDLGTKPLFTLVCVSVLKNHPFCLYETQICFSHEWWSWWWVFSFTDLPCIVSRKVGKLNIPSGICLAGQPERKLEEEGRREKSLQPYMEKKKKEIRLICKKKSP